MYSDEDHSYHSHYSEENIYKLAFKYKNQFFDHEDSPNNSFVVFISNEDRHVPLWKQKVGMIEGQPVVWDYHVIFLIRNDEGLSVIDLDSSIGYRVPFDTYVQQTLRPDLQQKDESKQQFFRVVPAEDFLDYFASDRSHMVDQSKAGAGTAESTTYPQVYKQVPPPWPTIIGFKADCENNAEKYISMKPQDSDIYGKVFSLKEFIGMGQHLDHKYLAAVLGGEQKSAV